VLIILLANFKRTLLSVGVNLFLQLTGNIFVTIYGAVFMSGLNGVNAFTMTTINSAVNAVFTLLSQLLIDRVGRRYASNFSPFLPLTKHAHTPSYVGEKRVRVRVKNIQGENKISFFGTE
jgi:Sugar (and other) transporter.